MVTVFTRGMVSCTATVLENLVSFVLSVYSRCNLQGKEHLEFTRTFTTTSTIFHEPLAILFHHWLL